jgi:DNA-binding NtrC family response regulator
MEAMMSYEWPGNVRELENCVQHLVAINSGPLLHVPDLPSSVQNHIALKKGQFLVAAASASAARPNGPVPFQGIQECPILPLSEVEKRAILQALEYTKGDRVMAAHLLDIGRTTLYRKLKEYQLEAEL